MLCQNCKINESTIHLYTNVNGKQHQVDLCQNCYQIMKTDPNNALFRGMTNMNNQNNLDPFDDFFSNIGNFQNHQEPQVSLQVTEYEVCGLFELHIFVVHRPYLQLSFL